MDLGAKDVRRVPYRLIELIEATAAGHPVLIVEGEKDANAAWRIGLPATCNPGGAGKWRDEFNEFFRGADVVLVPDNDEPGWKHVNDIGARLKSVAARVRVLVLPNGAKDLTEWLDAGGTREQLDALIESAPEWVMPADDAADKARATAQEDELIEALSRMRAGIQFDRERARIARELGVNRAAIDAEVEARRSGREEEMTAPLYGHWVVEPSPEVVEGDALLRDIILRIRRHVVCTPDDALALALWVVFAWVHDEVATHSPILAVISAEPESGKSTALGVVSFLVPRCVASVEISEAALFRAIKLWKPSFVIDEFDSVLADDNRAALRSVINSGHTCGQGVVRCVEPDFRPELFTTFCPKAIGMIGRKLPASTLSRCIVVELRRKKTTERVDRFGHKDDAGLAELRSRLLRWSVDKEEALRGAEPLMPPAFDNRRADNWRLMFAIADLAGGDWGDNARLAAVRLESVSDTRTIGVRLLADIKRIFDEFGATFIGSTELVGKLTAEAESPWSEFGKSGKPITANRVARILGGLRHRARERRGPKEPRVPPASVRRRLGTIPWARITLATVPGVPNIDGCGTSGKFKVSGEAISRTVVKSEETAAAVRFRTLGTL